MTFDQETKRRGGFHLGAFSWPWMLREGVGLVVGYMRDPNSDSVCYIFQPDEKGASPTSNDNYHVSAHEARAMAMAARGLATCCRFANAEWDKMSEAEQTEARRFWPKAGAVRDDFIAQFALSF